MPFKFHYYYEPIHEPLVLEPEDWTPSEWHTILKLFGMLDAERIVVSDYTLQGYGKKYPRNLSTSEYRIWTRFYDDIGNIIGSSVSAKSYKREGNAVRVATQRYENFPYKLIWIVSKENPWPGIDSCPQ